MEKGGNFRTPLKKRRGLPLALHAKRKEKKKKRIEGKGRLREQGKEGIYPSRLGKKGGSTADFLKKRS